MELAAILQARAVAFVEPTDLNPRAKVFYPDIVKALLNRYNFQKFPQKFEDLDEAKGVTFGMGRLGESVIDEFIIYPYGLVLDTRVSTQESKRLLEEAILWGSKELGLVNKPVPRWQYASHVTFLSKVPLTGVHPAVQGLADVLTKSAAEGLGENLKYELTALMLDFDQLTRKHPLGRFSIQRRDNTPFSENKYFSDAPLPTDVHLKMLEQFEAAMLANERKPIAARKPGMGDDVF
jgi:hypothetical protein